MPWCRSLADWVLEVWNQQAASSLQVSLGKLTIRARGVGKPPRAITSGTSPTETESVPGGIVS